MRGKSRVGVLFAGLALLILVAGFSPQAQVAWAGGNDPLISSQAPVTGFDQARPTFSSLAGEILEKPYGDLTCAGVITFNDVVGGPAPGTNYDVIFESDGADFAERFAGQVLSYSGDFDVLSGNPNNPLALQVGLPSENLSVYSYLGTEPVLTGLGPRGFPNFDAIGEGSFAVLFDFDQSEFGFDLLGGDGGSANVSFFRRDGSLIDVVILNNLGNQSYGFARAGGVNDIAGISIDNTDPAGMGFDDLCHDVPGFPDTCTVYQSNLLLQGYTTVSYIPPMWTVRVNMFNAGPGMALNVAAMMQEDIPWLTIPDPNCFYGNVAQGATSSGAPDDYTFDLTGWPGGSFNVWFDVTYEDTCGVPYRVRLDPEFDLDDVTNVPNAKASAHILNQNFPNPFNPATEISFEIPAGETVTLKVYDVSGKLVRTLVNGFRNQGIHNEAWDGRDNGGKAVSAGVYFYRMETATFTQTRRMVLLK